MADINKKTPLEEFKKNKAEWIVYLIFCGVEKNREIARQKIKSEETDDGGIS